MKKFPVSRKLIIVSFITISALLTTACQSRPTKVDSTTKDNSTNNATTTYQDKTEENTSSNADESTTVNGELSGESTGDITTEGSGDETTNIGDAETNNGSIDNSTETTTPKPTEPPTPDFLEQIALTEAEKADGYGLTYVIEYSNKMYLKYRMEKIGGKDILAYMHVGTQLSNGEQYITTAPSKKYILDMGQRVVSTRINGTSLGYFAYKPGIEGRVPIMWESPVGLLSHYYQGASMYVYTPWRCSSTEGPMVHDPNGEFIDKETYLYYMALYGNAIPDELSALDPNFVWTYDEISIEYDFVYDFYMFIETHLKGTEYENAFLEFNKYITPDGLYCGRYEVLDEGPYYDFFRELQKNNQ